MLLMVNCMVLVVIVLMLVILVLVLMLVLVLLVLPVLPVLLVLQVAAGAVGGLLRSCWCSASSTEPALIIFTRRNSKFLLALTTSTQNHSTTR
jgi:hypothetical protein